jgi:transposase
MTLAAEMPVRAIGDLAGEHDTRLWRVAHHRVERALGAQDLSGVERLAVDEPSFSSRAGTTYRYSLSSTKPGSCSRPRP